MCGAIPVFYDFCLRTNGVAWFDNMSAVAFLFGSPAEPLGNRQQTCLNTVDPCGIMVWNPGERSTPDRPLDPKRALAIMAVGPSSWTTR